MLILSEILYIVHVIALTLAAGLAFHQLKSCHRFYTFILLQIIWKTSNNLFLSQQHNI